MTRTPPRRTRRPGRALTRLAGVGGLAALSLPVVTLAGVGGALALDQAPAAAAATCAQAGTTGLSAAKVVSTSTSTLTGTTIAATGCDVGIYVAPTTSGVTIKGVTVTGANDHGIFAENTSGLVIETSTVTGNGVRPTPGIFDNKAIELVGVTNATITKNTVTYNTADGGIGIQDNGPLDSGAPKPGPTTPVATHDITVSDNNVSHNTGGCGIVVAAHNPGGGVSNVTLDGNTIASTPFKMTPTGPEIGGIVVDAPIPHTSINDVSVTDNTITGSLIAGIAVYAGGGPAASVSSVRLTANTLSADGWGEQAAGRPRPEAIMVAAYPSPPGTPPATVTGTVITGNAITNEYYGLWLAYTTGTTSSPNSITTVAGGIPIYDVPLPGTGYWLAARDGGVFSEGSAGFYGSMAGKSLNAPIVGMYPTIDQAGYWLVGADGGVFTFGDANFFGSMAGEHLNAPVVGMARTPFYAPAPGETPSPGAEGYWLVGADGGVFGFGDAAFYGSLPAMGIHVSDVVGIAPTPDGHGYWLVGADGGVFSFGDAAYYGSLPGIGVHVSDIVGIAPTPDGHGYWLVGADGGVFSFGDARFFGSMGGTHLDAPLVGGAAVGVIGAG